MSGLNQEMKIKLMEKELEILKELEDLLGDDFMVIVSERLDGSSLEEILKTNPERMVDEPTSEIVKKILSRRYQEYLETEPKEELKEEPTKESSDGDTEKKVYTEEEIERIAQERVEQRLREEEKKRMLQQQLEEERKREEEERKRVEEEIRSSYQRSLGDIENLGKDKPKAKEGTKEDRKKNLLVGIGIGVLGLILLGLIIVFVLPKISPYIKETTSKGTAILVRDDEKNGKVSKDLPEYLEKIYVPVLEKQLDTKLEIKEETIDLTVDKFTYDNLGEDKREVLLPMNKKVLADYFETPYSVKTDISGLHNLETSQALSSVSGFPVTPPRASTVTTKVAVFEIGVLQPTPEGSREVLAGLEPGHFAKYQVNDAVIPIYVEKPKKENLISYAETGTTKEEVNSKNKLNPIKRIQIVSDKGIVTEFLYSSYKEDVAYRWVRF